MVTNIVLTTVFSTALIGAYYRYAADYPRQVFLSGWLLFVIMLVLTFFNLLKRVPFLRLGSARFWLQMHIYLGIFSGVLFCVHLGMGVPEGIFHRVLAICFLAVFLSGIIGLWISRSFPKLLTVAGHEIPYEQIPVARRNLRLEAEKLVANPENNQTSKLIAEFYTEKLARFFMRHCNFYAHIRRSQLPHAAHDSQFDELRRYLKSKENETLEAIYDLVVQKHALDYQYSLQTTLRVWLFTHIPLTYALLILSLLHILVVYVFSSAVT